MYETSIVNQRIRRTCYFRAEHYNLIDLFPVVNPWLVLLPGVFGGPGI